MLSQENWVAPEDYKVYCFNGVPMYVMVCVGRDKGGTMFFYFDKDWNLMPYSNDALEHPDFKMEKPAVADELFEYARRLAKPFPFVRADFYISGDKIYFGELTFTPSGGLDANRLKETDMLFGNMIDLNYKA